MFEKGFFGGLFDLDGNGKLDNLEKSADLGMLFGLTEEEERKEEITDAGLDYDELGFMDEDERNTALADAGLDPDDYDFLF